MPVTSIVNGQRNAYCVPAIPIVLDWVSLAAEVEGSNYF
jgi:hypothetical protein